MKLIYLALEVMMFFSAIPLYLSWRKWVKRIYRPNLIGWACVQVVAWASVATLRSEYDLKHNWGAGKDLFLYFSGWMWWYFFSLVCIVTVALIAGFAITPAEFLDGKTQHEDNTP